MADAQQAPEGWYMLGENPLHYGYYNGVTWARHRWLDPAGIWQEQILHAEVPQASEHPASTGAEGSFAVTGGSAWQRGEGSLEPAHSPEEPALVGAGPAPAGQYPNHLLSGGITGVQHGPRGGQILNQVRSGTPGKGVESRCHTPAQY